MAAGAPSLLFGRTLNTAAARPVRHLIQRSSTAAASLGARQAPQPWTTGAWGAAAARRAPTCPAPAAGMSSSSGSAGAMAAAASPSAALAPSTVIDVEPPASSAASTATGASVGSAAGLSTLEDLPFDNVFTRELPAGGSDPRGGVQRGGVWRGGDVLVALPARRALQG